MVAYYGILRAGAVVVPMNVLNKRREVEYYLRDSGAKLLFVWHDFAGEAEPAAAETRLRVHLGRARRVRADAVPGRPARRARGAPVRQTRRCCSTPRARRARPKGAELTHDNLLRNCRASRDLFDLGAGTVVLGALPLFHSFGQTCAMNNCVVAVRAC